VVKGFPVYISGPQWLEVSIQAGRLFGKKAIVTKTNGRIGAVVHTVWRPTRGWVYSAALKWAEQYNMARKAAGVGGVGGNQP
jgi:hypothetical protein